MNAWNANHDIVDPYWPGAVQYLAAHKPELLVGKHPWECAVNLDLLGTRYGVKPRVIEILRSKTLPPPDEVPVFIMVLKDLAAQGLGFLVSPFVPYLENPHDVSELYKIAGKNGDVDLFHTTFLQSPSKLPATVTPEMLHPKCRSWWLAQSQCGPAALRVAASVK